MTATANAPDERDLEVNLQEAEDLSHCLEMLLAGITSRGYPFGIGEKHLQSIYTLATEVSLRAREANRQRHEDSKSCLIWFSERTLRGVDVEALA